MPRTRSITLLVLSICLFAFPFLIGGGYKSYFAQGTTKGGDRKYKKREAEPDCDEDSFGVGLLPRLRRVLSSKKKKKQQQQKIEAVLFKRDGLPSFLAHSKNKYLLNE